MKKALFFLLFSFIIVNIYCQNPNTKKTISVEPIFSLGAGWWIYDRSKTNQWDRSHYIANLEVGALAHYHFGKLTMGLGATHSILDEDELIAYNDRAVRNKYKLTDGQITFNFLFLTTEYQVIRHKNYKLGPTLAFGIFDTPVNYPNHTKKDHKTFWKVGISNEIGLSRNIQLHIQLQYITMKIKPIDQNIQKSQIYNLSLLFGVRFYLF